MNDFFRKGEKWQGEKAGGGGGGTVERTRLQDERTRMIYERFLIFLFHKMVFVVAGLLEGSLHIRATIL